MCVPFSRCALLRRFSVNFRTSLFVPINPVLASFVTVVPETLIGHEVITRCNMMLYF